MITGGLRGFVVGVGARRGASSDDVRTAVSSVLGETGFRARDIACVVTARGKESDPALREVARLLGVPLRGLPVDVLTGQPVPNPSAAVRKSVGTPSVAEAAVLAAGAELIIPKQVRGGVTVAVGRLPAPSGSPPDTHATVATCDAVAGARDAVAGACDAVAGARDAVAGARDAVAGARDSVAGGHVADPAAFDLAHHGDAEIAPGLVDLAVNVDGPAPSWLADRLRAAVDGLAAYPDPRAASEAVAARHGRPVEQVLLTAGAAEGFVLLARALRPRRAVVFHPQFTGPEAALRAAGHAVHRLELPPPFTLDPGRVPDDADLVVMGNPTNPTSVLHPAADLLCLARPGRVLLVDEAFMDAVPGEDESLAGTFDRASRHVPGLVVARSLTKIWGLAGLRIGYLLGDPDVLRACAAAQPLWSVGSLALEAAIACSSAEAGAEVARIAKQKTSDRDHLLELLAGLDGIEVTTPARAPFVLIRVWGPDPAGVHRRLRDDGLAVRRADTFPGLGPGWLRAAVRDPGTSARFAAALARAVHPDRHPTRTPTDPTPTEPGTTESIPAEPTLAEPTPAEPCTTDPTPTDRQESR
jgi:histidinol-phosphate aminotransferase